MTDGISRSDSTGHGGDTPTVRIFPASEAANSQNPAHRLTTPRPETAPRTSVSRANPPNRGTVSTSKFRSQNIDHGATSSTNPVSKRYTINRTRPRRCISSSQRLTLFSRVQPPRTPTISLHRDTDRKRKRTINPVRQQRRPPNPNPQCHIIRTKSK